MSSKTTKVRRSIQLKDSVRSFCVELPMTIEGWRFLDSLDKQVGSDRLRNFYSNCALQSSSHSDFCSRIIDWIHALNQELTEDNSFLMRSFFTTPPSNEKIKFD